VYNDRLEPLDFDSIARNEKCVVMVTGYSCGGCVEYFAKEKIARTFIYFINDLSIMEMNRVRFQAKARGLNFYYVLRSAETDGLYTAKSPQMLWRNGNALHLIDYRELDRVTDGFSLKGKKARKNIAELASYRID
jgi:hypothetical protein